MKLTKAQRAFLNELSECPLYVLPSATRAMAQRLRKRRLVSFRPETASLNEEWTITEAGRAALASGGEG